jgi:hypothetical protein
MQLHREIFLFLNAKESCMPPARAMQSIAASECVSTGADYTAEYRINALS